jgi:hypothetical protein
VKPLQKAIAAHPLAVSPYDRIKFSRVDNFGTALYKVGNGKREMGAATALRTAIERFGGTCFHCKASMPPQPLSQQCTRDHLRPKHDGGGDYLHNLVVACGPCNRQKGGTDVISFRPEAGDEYLKALDAHLIRCLKKLDSK